MMALEPLVERIGFSIGQDIDHTVGFEVNEQGCIRLPLADGPIIHSRHAWGRPGRHRSATKHAQQGMQAHWNLACLAHSSPWLASCVPRQWHAGVRFADSFDERRLPQGPQRALQRFCGGRERCRKRSDEPLPGAARRYSYRAGLPKCACIDGESSLMAEYKADTPQ